MWTYNSKTGELHRPDGTSAGYGFSGQGEGINNPEMEFVKNIGPIPRTTYKMTEWIQTHPKVGTCVIRLEPEDAEALKGRAGFLIHGPRNLTTYGLEKFLTTSEGCIIYGDNITRRAIWNSGDRTIKVI